MSRVWLCLTALICCAYIPVVALAHPAAPEATLKIVHNGPASLSWSGRGRTNAGVGLCLSSTTGRFELYVRTFSGKGLNGSTVLPYTVTLQMDGTTSTVVLSQSTPTARFTGSVAPQRQCSAGVNARLVLALDPALTLASNAGVYGDDLQLSIEPR